MTAGGGESKRRYRGFKRKMIDGKSSRKYSQDCATIFIDREEKVSSGCEIKMGNILAVGKGKSV
jgi:hypothetical protein